jgi:hypothetical protein
MSREEFERALSAHAEGLERAVALSTTRVEHVRVTAQAREARRLADVFREAGATAAA